MGELCGFEVSSTQVSNLTATLDEEFEKWRTRLLPEISQLFLDATYYKVRITGNARDCATLIALEYGGITAGASSSVSPAPSPRPRSTGASSSSASRSAVSASPISSPPMPTRASVPPCVLP